MNLSKKIFVLDTNVILHDSTCIDRFEEHNVIIPIGVLEELDQFKKGNEILNFHARQFVRELDSLTGDGLFDGGVKLGPDRGYIMIQLEQAFHPDVAQNFKSEKIDHHILNTAYCLAQEHSDTQVVLVTKDVNLRLKAKSIGVLSQDYTTDHVKNISELYTGRRIVEDVAPGFIKDMYTPPFELPVTDLLLEGEPIPNEFFILRNGKNSLLATFDPFLKMYRKVDKRSAYNIQPRNAEQIFAVNALLNTQIQLVTLSGKAGTGKTLLALASALECLKSYRQIFMARPIVPLSNKDIGYLPGDIQSKLDPYMQPLFDNLGVIRNIHAKNNDNNEKIQKLLEDQKLVISPLSYIRGRSLNRIFFIVDEAQNLTPHEIKTIITRAGDGTKLVFTGDIFQIDHPYLNTHSNGLSYLIDRMQGQKIYAHINLEKGERSELADLASNLL